MMTGFIPTERDLGILNDLYSQTVMSFSQIQKHHFRDNSITTVSNRLRHSER